MRRNCLLLLLLCRGFFCFAQNPVPAAETGNFPAAGELMGAMSQALSSDMWNPVPLSVDNEQSGESQSIFANSPQWVKDLRRGEIVFFGTLPLTLFFTRTMVDLYRMGTHGWDQRYAPWPFQSAGAIPMSTGEILLTFGIALGASLSISIADHLIVQSKRNTKAAPEYSAEPFIIEEVSPPDDF